MAEAGDLPQTLDLDAVPEERLLDLRICDLPVRIEGTWLEDRVTQLHRELKSRDILFQPRCYLADEWLTPEGEPEIGIPFYLAHPRLIALEKKMMLEAEGSTHDWCMKLLRHEAGHAMSYAYGLHKRRSWQQVFGKSSQAYEDTYRFRPYSRSFVRHLDYYYAQYHPDEDWCETFAVWLTPGFDWHKQYRGWKALDKLLFVDQLMKGIAGQRPPKEAGRQYWKAPRIRSTLRRFYRKRQHAEAENLPAFHDANLKRMFPEAPGAGARSVARILHDYRKALLITVLGWTGEKRLRILHDYRKALLITVLGWTGEKRYMVNEVFKRIHQRAAELRLCTNDPEPAVILQLGTYLTTLMMNYRYTNRLRGRPRDRAHAHG